MKNIAAVYLLFVFVFSAQGRYVELFTSPSWVSTGFVCIGDTNNDGLNEIVLTSYHHVAIFSYDGDSFNLDANWNLDSVQAAFGIAIGDSDNDGLNEIILGTWAQFTNPNLVYQFDGHDYIVKHAFPSIGYGQWSIEIVNTDGVAGNEIIIGERYGRFHALRWDGVQFSKYYSSPDLVTGRDGIVWILGVGDTNGNGKQDVVTYCEPGFIDIFESNGNNFTHIYHKQFPNGNDKRNTKKGIVVDIDGDGIKEIFYSDVFGNITGIRHDGSSYIEFFNKSIGWNPISMSAGDVDRDGIPDLVVGGHNGELAVIKMDGSSTYIGKYDSELIVVVGDATNDGYANIVAGDSSGKFRVFTYTDEKSNRVKWDFEDFALGNINQQGTSESRWLVPAGVDAPEIVSGDAHDGSKSVKFSISNYSSCSVEHDITKDINLPASGLWELSFALKCNFDQAAEIQFLVEDRNIVTEGVTPGSCVQFSIINGPEGIYPAIWNNGSYSDLRSAFGIDYLDNDIWYQLIIAGNSLSSEITHVTLFGVPWRPPITVEVNIPYGGSSGAGAVNGLPEYLTIKLTGDTGGTNIVFVDNIIVEEGYARDNQPWDDLQRAFQNIYRDGWPNIYIQMANSIIINNIYTEAQYVTFFQNYLENNYWNSSLSGYIGYPTFFWYSSTVHSNLQNAMIRTFPPVAFSIIEDNAVDLAKAFRESYELGETCATLHAWVQVLIQNSSFISLSTWQEVNDEYMFHISEYPQYFDASNTLNITADPWIALIQAQFYTITRNILPYDEQRKLILGSSWGLPGDRLRIFNDTDVLILDNNKFNEALYDLIYDFLVSLPSGSKNLQSITCYDELRKMSESFVIFMPAGVNIWNGDPLEDPFENNFPEDIEPSLACSMAGVLVHEVMHNIDGYNNHNGPGAGWWLDRKSELINAAGCNTMQYLRGGECFFVNNPQEFTASIGNQYFTDTAHTLNLAIQRWNSGYRQPINQWMIMAELFGQTLGNNTTRFWRIDTDANVNISDKIISWKGNRISRIVLNTDLENYGWRFDFDTNDMVEGIYSLVDLNSDGTITSSDLFILANNWLSTCSAPGWCNNADVNMDGKVDLFDLLVLAANWLTCTAPECD